MDLLIVYSETKKGEVLSLASLLHEKGIQFQPFVLPGKWGVQESEDLYRYLRDESHWLFLLSLEDLSNPAFLFATGFCAGVHERCYFLDVEGALLPGYWKTLFQISPDFPSLVETLDLERQRWALFLSRLQARERLAERGLEVTNSSFLEAVEKGDFVSCELFLQAGFSPDLTDKKGVTVLCLAVRSAHLGVLRLLLGAGADVNLHSKDRDNSALMDAAAEGLFEMVQELIGHGASLTGLSRNGQSALVLAIGKGAEDVAGLLLDAGADPFVADKLGMNACLYAQLLRREEFLGRVKAKYPDRF